jgi:hypothetical protein
MRILSELAGMEGSCSCGVCIKRHVLLQYKLIQPSE